MNNKFKIFIFFLGAAAFFIGAGCSPTYKRDTISEHLVKLAKDEYKLDVTVVEMGQTVAIQIQVENLMAELISEDQHLWTELDDLRMVLTRVALSCDRPPAFVVLDIGDAGRPYLHFVMTQYVDDLHKVMAEALSRDSFLDRLILEFIIGEKQIVFDPYEWDLVRITALSADILNDENINFKYKLSEVFMPDFLAKVAAKTLKRMIRENKKFAEEYSLQELNANYLGADSTRPAFNIIFELVQGTVHPLKASIVEASLLPAMASSLQELFKSYHFENFNAITLQEVNTGAFLMVPGI